MDFITHGDEMRWAVAEAFMNSVLAILAVFAASIVGYWIFDYQSPIVFNSVKPAKSVFHMNELIEIEFDYTLLRYCPAAVSRYLIDVRGMRIGVVSTAGLSGRILGEHRNLIGFAPPRNLPPGAYRFGSYVNYACNLLHTIPAMSGPTDPFEVVP